MAFTQQSQHSQASLPVLLEKMTSDDKDLRYMAANDLLTELTKEAFRLERFEPKVVEAILKLLGDTNGEVQNLAIKCIPALLGKVSDELTLHIINTLTTRVATADDQTRDISSLGLKGAFSALTLQSPVSIQAALATVERLLALLSKEKKDATISEALDVVVDVTAKFAPIGAHFTKHYAALQETSLAFLKHSRPGIRKRGLNLLATLAPLVASNNDTDLAVLTNYFIDVIASKPASTANRTNVQALTVILRAVPGKLDQFVPKIVLILLKSLGADDDEFRETVLQCVEAILDSSTTVSTALHAQVIDPLLRLLKHDPNYNDDEGDDGEMDTAHGEGQSEPESDGAYSDDDDMSWKVRRSAAKALQALIRASSAHFAALFNVVSPTLISRFNEREESVRLDVLAAYAALLQHYTVLFAVFGDHNALEHSTVSSDLNRDLKTLVHNICRQLSEKKILKARQGALAVLHELTTLTSSTLGLTSYLHTIIVALQANLSDKASSSTLKIEVVHYINHVLALYPPDVFLPLLPSLAESIVRAVNDGFYKLSAEGLACVIPYLTALRPYADRPLDPTNTPIVRKLFDAIKGRVSAVDSDQEVKDKSIMAIATLIATAGDVLADVLPAFWPILLQRLQNDLTRLTATRAIALLSRSQLPIDFSSILVDTIKTLATFLRKNNRSLRIAALSTLDVLIQSYDDRQATLCGLLEQTLTTTSGTARTSNAKRPRLDAMASASSDVQLLEHVLQELPVLVDASDLHSTQLALNIVTSIIICHQPTALTLNDKFPILPSVLALVQHGVAPGPTLSSTLRFLATVVSLDLPSLRYNDVLQGLKTIGQCIAAITPLVNSSDTINAFVADLRSPANDAVKVLALISIGELGKRIDLSSQNALLPVVMECLTGPSEDIAVAASFCLGALGVGSVGHFLPFILQQLTILQAKDYLLLSALKDCLVYQIGDRDGDAIQPFVPQVWTLLQSHCETQDEGTRAIVSECLGKLVQAGGEAVLSQLLSNLSASSSHSRATAVQALRVVLAVDSLAPHIVQHIKPFFDTIKDDDVLVRRAGLQAVNSAVHYHASLLAPYLQETVALVYAETNTRKELIRVVQMGPFKHTIDDGLEARKAAFECLNTLIECSAQSLVMADLLTCVLRGLQDTYDIQILTFLMLGRLCRKFPLEVAKRTVEFVAILERTVNAKLKANAVKQESDKFDELKRTAVKAVASLNSLPDSDKVASLQALVKVIRSQPALRASFEETTESTMDTA